MKKRLSASNLKLIAILTMTIDHIAWVFIKDATLLSYGMHTLGQITFPVMGYFISVGYTKTHSFRNYSLRLLLFAFLSAVPFYLVFGTPFNVLFTLFFGLLAICFHNHMANVFYAQFCIFLLALISLPFDWGFIGVYVIYGFYLFNARRKYLFLIILGEICYFAVLYIPLLLNGDIMAYFLSIPLGSCLALPLLSLYNEKKGITVKYLFYIFYPAHLIALYLLNKMGLKFV